MVIGGLDIATTSGLAHLKGDDLLTTTFRGATKNSFLDTSKFGDLNPMLEGDIGRRWEDFLRVWLIDCEITHLALEAPIPSNPTRTKEEIDVDATFAGQAVRKFEVGGTNITATYRIYGMAYVALSLCARLNIPRWFVPQSTWRKEILGHGRPKNPKQEAKAFCEKMGIQVSSLDAAEAACIALWLDRKLSPTAARRRGEDLFASPAP